jgi:hypothetical protein
MEKEQKKKKRGVLIFLIILVIIIFFLGLDYRGYIDLSKFGINFGDNSEISKNNSISSPGECPVTSCDTGECCGHNDALPGEIPQVLAVVLIRDACACPSDTDYLWTDSATEGGPWKHCACKNLTSS